MAGALSGKAALVTGAGSGIGRATALAFAREGARLVVSDVDAATGEETARAATAAGAVAHFVHCDVTRTADVDDLVARATELLGGLDCAFNNAGIEGALTPLAECSEELFARVIDVNLLGVWRCLRAELPRMGTQGSGAVVNAASIAGVVGASGLAAYVASKHGVVGLTKAAALEYAKTGVRVNAVCPGIIATPMVDRLAAANPGLIESLVAAEPMGRLGAPDEVAAAVVWLCSDAASFTTGHCLVVDGGYVVP